MTLESKLRTGDVLLVRGHTPIISVLIKKITNSEYSHALCYLGCGHYIESDWFGVQFKTTLDVMKLDYDVFRHKEADIVELYNATGWMMEQSRKGYDYRGILGILLSTFSKSKQNHLDDKRKFWCSELIADGYLSAKIPMDCSEHTYKYSPGDFAKSQFFRRVE